MWAWLHCLSSKSTWSMSGTWYSTSIAASHGSTLVRVRLSCSSSSRITLACIKWLLLPRHQVSTVRRFFPGFRWCYNYIWKNASSAEFSCNTVLRGLTSQSASILHILFTTSASFPIIVRSLQLKRAVNCDTATHGNVVVSRHSECESRAERGQAAHSSSAKR